MVQWGGTEKEKGTGTELKDPPAIAEAKLIQRRIEGLLELVVERNKKGFKLDERGQLKPWDRDSIDARLDHMTDGGLKRSGSQTAKKLGNAEVVEIEGKRLVVLKGKFVIVKINPYDPAELTAYRNVMQQLGDLTGFPTASTEDRVEHFLNSQYFEREK